MKKEALIRILEQVFALSKSVESAAEVGINHTKSQEDLVDFIAVRNRSLLVSVEVRKIISDLLK